MIGLSLSYCIHDIAEGHVSLADVEKIITGTRCNTTADWAILLDDYGRTYWRNTREQAFRALAILLATGRIDQPRTRDETPPDSSFGRWIGGISVARAEFDKLVPAIRDVITLTAVDLNKPVAAIKALRAVTTLGLTDAKSVIDSLRGVR